MIPCPREMWADVEGAYEMYQLDSCLCAAHPEQLTVSGTVKGDTV